MVSVIGHWGRVGIFRLFSEHPWQQNTIGKSTNGAWYGHHLCFSYCGCNRHHSQTGIPFESGAVFYSTELSVGRAFLLH